MDQTTPNVMYYGREAPLPERTPLRAGPLSLAFENGDLRWVRFGKAEAVRRVYVAVRDHNWGTASTAISNLNIHAEPDSFQITYDAMSQLNAIQFAWRAGISGASDGTIVFTMDGVAQSAFMTNRIGFCVLHPMLECAGTACVIEHGAGCVEHGIFPTYIAPHQPFVDIRAIQYDVSPGCGIEVRFAGDVFEMEDQRNWTDASFKTYCTPLSKPYPREVVSGSHVTQTVTISAIMKSSDKLSVDNQAHAHDGITRIYIKPDRTTSVPYIGLGISESHERLSHNEVKRLQALRLNHLRVDLDLRNDEYPMRLSHAIDAAKEIGTGLEIALFLSDNGERELDHLVWGVLPRLQPPLASWIVFHINEKTTSTRWLKMARPLLHSYDASALIGGGTITNFTELNRNKPGDVGLDFAAYSINPQVHAIDSGSLVENLAAQAETVRSAKHFMSDLPIHVSPVTLKPRLSPDASESRTSTADDRLPADVDVRQMSLFGAGWTLGSLKYLAESGVASVTYYSSTGWKGVMETEDGSPLPGAFRSTKGGVYPLYHVLASAGEFTGGQVLHTQSTQPLVADALLLRHGDRNRLIVANMTNEEQRVTVPVHSGKMKQLALDETTFDQATRDPIAFYDRHTAAVTALGDDYELTLLPFGTAFLEW